MTTAALTGVLTDEHLTDLFEQQALKVPESLRDLYLEELQKILLETQLRIKKLLTFRKVIDKDEVEFSVDQWLKMTPKKIAYSGYVKYLETHHWIEKKNPCTFKEFLSKAPNSPTISLYEKWLIIEKYNLIPNAKVWYKNKIFTVRGMTTHCHILFEGEQGNFNPIAFQKMQKDF